LPDWGDENFDRGPRPITPETIIEVVDKFGERGQYRLQRMEAREPRYPNVKSQVWVDVHQPSNVLDDADIEQWMPTFFPQGKAGDLEHAYRNAMHHLSREHRRQETEHDEMIAEMGMMDVGARLNSAAMMPAGARGGVALSETTPVTSMYDSNADGTRSYMVGVWRDDVTGDVRFDARGDVDSQRAKKVISYMQEHKEKIAAWRERGAALEAISNQAGSVLHEYKNETGEWL
jgi:hypothetical protein